MKLPKIYEPGEYEKDIYALWEKKHAFTADPASTKEHFSIAMPPPNETGTLSLGHALFLTLQDITARYQRLQGKDVLWLPGTDHAALPVNAIIEKQLTDMKSGDRINVAMAPIVKGLSPQDIKDVAAYVTLLPWNKEKYLEAQQAKK